MENKPFTDAEKGEAIEAARFAAETESPWVQLGEYFRAKRSEADKVIEARPTRKSD